MTSMKSSQVCGKRKATASMEATKKFVLESDLLPKEVLEFVELKYLSLEIGSVITVKWESFDKQRDWFETPRKETVYLIEGVVTAIETRHGLVNVEFGALKPFTEEFAWWMSFDWFCFSVAHTQSSSDEVLTSKCLEEWINYACPPPRTQCKASKPTEKAKKKPCAKRECSTKLKEAPSNPSISSSNTTSIDSIPTVTVMSPSQSGGATSNFHRQGLPQGSLSNDSLKSEEPIIDDDPSDHPQEQEEIDPCTVIEGRGKTPPTIEFQSDQGIQPCWKRKYEGHTPAQIFMSIATEMLEHVVHSTNMRQHINGVEDQDIGLGDLLSYVSFRVYMTILKLPKIDNYFSNEVFKSLGFLDMSHCPSSILSKELYDRITRNLTFEDYSTLDFSGPDRAKKVRTITNLTQKAFRSIIPHPGKHLTVDEGMGKCEVSRNPIFSYVPNKPTDEGFKWFCLVDHGTKICINFHLADGADRETSCSGVHGGYAGQQVLRLIENLPDTGRIIYMDSYYTSMALALELRRKGYGMVGTVRKNTIPKSLQFPGKIPRPSQPNGSLNFGCTTDGLVNVYSWMNSTACYFIDSVWGPDLVADVVSSDTAIPRVPEGIAMHIKHMSGVDTFNQLRTNQYSLEKSRRTIKWTHRYFDCLLSAIIANTYLIHRQVNEESDDLLTFQLALYRGLAGNTFSKKYTTKKVAIRGDSTTIHQLVQTPPGSLFPLNKTDLRRYSSGCRNCPNTLDGKKNYSRKTTWFCLACKVPLHPDCSTPFHSQDNFCCPEPLERYLSLTEEYFKEVDAVYVIPVRK